MDTLLEVHGAPRRVDVIRLLSDAGLPTADLTDEHMQDFFYVGPWTAPIGVVGVQIHGADALLRSLAVTAAHRAQGIGRRLVEHAEQHARGCGAANVYLLTTTAESFFRSRGYRVMLRDGAPAAIRSTSEFAGLCPASSIFMSKRL